MIQRMIHSGMVFGYLLLAVSALADTPDDGSAGQVLLPRESIEELSRREEHFSAMARYYERRETLTLSDSLAAARSAWALGLVDEARRLWKEALANQEFRGEERFRALLAQAIMELQEGNYETARSIGEESTRELSKSDLRAQFLLVIGEALVGQGALSLAEQYFKQAASEGNTHSKAEALCQLGENQLKLGMTDEARYSFAAVDMSSRLAPKALRRLVEIDLLQRNYEGVLTWVEEGREAFPSEFRDAATCYAYISALVELGQLARARTELNDLRVRHSDSNPWYVVSTASFEAAMSKTAPVRARLRREGR